MDECIGLTLFSFFLMLIFRITRNVCVNEDECMRLTLFHSFIFPDADSQSELFFLKLLNSCKFDINILLSKVRDVANIIDITL